MTLPKLYLLAALSAALTLAACLAPRLWALSFVSLYPLIYACLRNGLSGRPLGSRLLHGAGLGFCFGFAYYSAALYWMWQFMPGLNFAAGLLYGSFACLFGLLSPFFTRRFSFCLAGLPALWTGCELLRSLGPFGFCWYGISNLQAPNLPLLQYVSLFGCRVLDYLIVFAVCAGALFFTDRSRAHRLLAMGALVLFAAVQIGGELFIRPLEGADKTVKLVQADLDPATKTDDVSLERHIYLSRKDPRADLVIWPETAVSILTLSRSVPIADTARAMRAPVLAGANIPQGDNYTNSAALYSAKGKRVGRYDKRRLVPFGEYTPAKKLFAVPPNPRLTEWEAVPGRRAEVLKTGPFRIGVTVCHESSFWQYSAHQVRAGANVLALVCNDGWCRSRSASNMHFQFARLRAAENRRWYLRCTSTGISGVVSPYGQIVKRGPEDRVAVITAPFGFETKKTLFTRAGDLFSPLCAAAAAVFAVCGWVFERRGQ